MTIIRGGVPTSDGTDLTVSHGEQAGTIHGGVTTTHGTVRAGMIRGMVLALDSVTVGTVGMDGVIHGMAHGDTHGTILGSIHGTARVLFIPTEMSITADGIALPLIITEEILA